MRAMGTAQDIRKLPRLRVSEDEKVNSDPKESVQESVLGQPRAQGPRG